MKFDKNIFPEIIFKDIEKKDGYIALSFIVGYFLFSFFYIYLVKDFMLGIKTSIPIELRRLITGIGFYILPVIIIFIILNVRKQKITTIGFRREGLKQSIVLGIILTLTISLIHIMKNKELNLIIYNIIFYIILLGFSEEIVFRGFLWPRFVASFGKRKGTILSGIFFGIMHSPLNIVLKGTFIPIAIFNEIGGGVLYSLLFIYIYTRNNNIVLPAVIHGILDFL